MSVKKRIFTFAPASSDTQCELKGVEKIRRHVPRHIELTAVLVETLHSSDFNRTIIKESKRIERFKKPLEFESNNNRVKII